jgi:hypothetical protein
MAEGPPATGDDPPGRVHRDADGNVVWEWEAGGGASTSRLLKRLDVPGLELLDEPGVAPGEPSAAKAAKAAKLPPREQGFDPYGGHAERPRATRPAAPAPEVRKRSLLSRLFGRR